MEGRLGGNTTDKVDSLGVDIGLVLISVVFLTDGNAGQRRTLFPEVCHNLTGVDARDGGNTLASAPFSKRLNSGPVAVLHGVVLDDNARGLNVGRLEVSEQAMLIAGGRGDTVVADQRLSEDEDLATV